MILGEHSVVCDVSSGPNPLVVGFSVLRSLLTVRSPGPFGKRTTDHRLLGDVLDVIARRGTAGLEEVEDELDAYLERQASLSPNELNRDEALAFWINLYNVGGLALSAVALRNGEDSVLGVPRGFQRKNLSVGGEALSLDDIEHGKLRRFRDPRVHAALVCGSMSCPTLRPEPYSGRLLGKQLDDQIRHFLSAGAISSDRDRGLVRLSRVFLWFGADFVRPTRMPGFLPARSKAILGSLMRWLDADLTTWIEKTEPDVEFQPYDWGLRCLVRE
jgi:hypothetical protein